MINIHAYLGPLSLLTFLLESLSLCSKRRWFFSFEYSSHNLQSWPLGRIWYHHTFSPINLYLKGCQLCPIFFVSLEMKSWWFLYCLPTWSCSSSVHWERGRAKEFVFIENFWISKLFQTQKPFWCQFKANLFWWNSSVFYGQVFISVEKYLFCFWWKFEVIFCWLKRVQASIWGF